MSEALVVDLDFVVRCGYCFGNLRANRAPECPSCGAAHHRDCWIENGGCVQFGCASGGSESGGQSVDENGFV